MSHKKYYIFICSLTAFLVLTFLIDKNVLLRVNMFIEGYSSYELVDPKMVKDKAVIFKGFCSSYVFRLKNGEKTYLGHISTIGNNDYFIPKDRDDPSSLQIVFNVILFNVLKYLMLLVCIFSVICILFKLFQDIRSKGRTGSRSC